MLDINAFSECIRKNLKGRRFGKERANGIIKDFEARTKVYVEQGMLEDDAAVLAMRDTFDRMSNDAAEKAKRTAKTLTVQANAMGRIKQGLMADSKLFKGEGEIGKGKGSRGRALGHAVKAIVIPDKRFSGVSYFDLHSTLKGQAFALLGDDLQKITVGAFGTQKGKAHLPNIVRELNGTRTGDQTAKNIADGWNRVSNFLVDSFNAAGGSMRKLNNYMPQVHNAVKMLKQGEAKFVSDHVNRLVDWNKTRWPDGSIIKEEDREGVMKAIFATQTSDGANKIDPKSFRGQGRALGNTLDQHRFLHYKGAEEWLESHSLYGDGNIFDVLNRHISDMTHKIALVETLGPNPEMMMRNIQAQAKALAYQEGLGASEINKMEAVFKNVVNPAFDVINRANPMNPESGLAMGINTVSNLTTSAVLGSVALTSTLGDLATTAVIRKLNGLPMMGGMHFYMDALKGNADGIANSSGWIFEQSINHQYAVERFAGTMNSGAELSRRVSDVTLRASGMVPLTTAARFRAQAEFSAYMARTAKTPYDKLPYKHVLNRYGISEAEWDAFRNIKVYSPEKGVKMLRPIDIMESDLKNKTEIFRKFQSMILSESRGMVPDSTIEASIGLKGTTRPDTLHGAILHSFSMYKNFPLTFMQLYGQYAMSTKTAKGRLGFVAGLAAASTIAGAMGVQLNEIKKGNDPMDMASGKFWLKAFLKGGGAGIWGDFLYQSTNQFGGGPAETIAGPVTGVVGDSLGLVLGAAGDLYSAEDMDEYKNNQARRVVDLLHRYTPGSNLWYAQQPLNKLFWEHLENAADPEADQRRQRRDDKRVQDYGNESYWKQGEALPERGPDFSRAFGGE